VNFDFGFIVTNLKWRSRQAVRFYNRRGTAGQWIKEGKNAVKWTKLSCFGTSVGEKSLMPWPQKPPERGGEVGQNGKTVDKRSSAG
jgi:hypothetical protein